MSAQVTVHNPKELTCFSSVRTHKLTVDEPVSAGGADLGASPWEHVLTGMGACTAITLRLYAQRKGWSLGEVSVHLERNGGPTEVVPIEIDVSMTGDLTDEQIERLRVIAGHCPVVKGVTSGLEVIESVKHSSTTS